MPNNSNKQWIPDILNIKLPILAVNLIAIMFYLSQYILLGSDSAVRFLDSSDGMIPLLISNAENYIKYGLSYWQPTMMGGFDSLSQGNKFTGINQIIFMIFSPVYAYKIHLFVYVIISVTGVYYLLRRENCSSHAASLMAVIYTTIVFSPRLALTYSNDSFAVMPWVFLLFNIFIDKQAKNITIKFASWIFLFLLGLVFSLTFQNEALSLPLILFSLATYFFLFYDKNGKFVTVIISMLLFIVGIATSSTVVITAAIDNSVLSQKAVLLNPEQPQSLNQQKNDHLSPEKVSSEILDGRGDTEKHIPEFWQIRHFLTSQLHYIIAAYSLPNIPGTLHWCIFLALVGWSINLWYKRTYLYSFSDLVFLLLPGAIAQIPEGLILSQYGIFKFIRFDRLGQTFVIFMLLFFSRYLIKSPPGLSFRACIWHKKIVEVSLFIAVIYSLNGPTGDWLYRGFKGSINYDLFKYGSQKELFDSVDMRAISNHLKESASGPFRVGTIAEKDLGPGFAASYGNETIDGYAFLVSKRFVDYWLEMNAKYIRELPPGTQIPPGLTGYLAIRILPSALNNHNEPYFISDSINLNLLRLSNTNYLFSPVLLADPELTLTSSFLFRKQLDSFYFIKHFANNNEISLSRLNGLTVYVYTLADSFPRYFGVFSQQCFQNPTILLKSMGQASAEQLRSEAFLLDQDCVSLLGKSHENNRADVNIIESSPDETLLKVNFSSPGILVSLTNYHPDWHAWIDSQNVQIFPVYHTFSGIVVQEGIHYIKLKYEPKYRDNLMLKFVHKVFSVFLP